MKLTNKLCVIFLACGAAMAKAQSNYTGGVIMEDFQSLPSSGSYAFSVKGPQALNQAPILAAGAVGWSLFANVGSTLAFVVDAGGGSGAAVYSYGLPGSGERALGFLANSTRVCRAGLRLVNGTGQTLTTATLSFVGEQWRSGGTPNANSLVVDYRIQATSFDVDAGGSYTAVPNLTFASPSQHAPGAALNGNLAANRRLLATTLALNWPAGHMLMIRWRDSDSTGDDDGLAIDDVVFHAGLATAAPQVVKTEPTASATGVLTASRLVVVFDQPVTVSDSWAQLTDGEGEVVTVSHAGGPLRYEITPMIRLASGQSHVLKLVAAQIRNAANVPLPADVDLPFTTQTAPLNPQRISAVQGTGSVTPLSGQVVTVKGVVTADFQGPPPALGGFFMQSLPSDDDGNGATSEGLYIQDFTSEGSAPVAVGEVVQVTGLAAESGSQTQLSQVTELSVLASASLPAPTEVWLPMLNASSLEPQESMRVRFPQTLHVSSVHTNSTFGINYARQGELILSVEGPLLEPSEVVDPNDDPASGVSYSGSSNVPAVAAYAAANSLRSLVLDDASLALYPDPTPFLNEQGTRRCGDTVTGLTGLLSYSGGRYRVQPTAEVSWVDANPRPATPPELAGDLRVAAMNVLNYFVTWGGADDRGADSAAEFQRQKDKVIAALQGLQADVLGLIEIQNNTAAVTDLLNALNEVSGADGYAVVPDGPQGAGSDAIRCLWLYRPSKVTLWGPCHADDDSVWNQPNPLRRPLAQVFEDKASGERWIACLNHWKSKSSGSATGPNLDQNDGQGAWNDLRRQQAARLDQWLSALSQAVGDADVLILGDLNAHGQEDPLDLLRAKGYEDQSARFDPQDYSYRLAEWRGRLDHALASSTMAAQIQGAGHWHINADEPAFYDYNLENKSTAQQLLNVATPYRSSDHDPILVGLRLSPQPTTYAMWQAAQSWSAGAATAMLSDPDQDGLPNLLEFVLNTGPEVPSSAFLPSGVVEGEHFHFDYRQRSRLSGLQVQPEWSDDLLTWWEISPISPRPSTEKQVEMKRATISISGRPRLFVRLRVTVP